MKRYILIAQKRSYIVYDKKYTTVILETENKVTAQKKVDSLNAVEAFDLEPLRR